MQCLIIRKPTVHANLIVEKEERKQQKARIVTFQNSPSSACTTKRASSVRQFQHQTWLDISRVPVNPENARNQRCTGGGGAGS